MGRKYPVDSYGVRSVRLLSGSVPADFSEDDYRAAIREARRQKIGIAEYLHRIRETRRQSGHSNTSRGVYQWKTLPPVPLPLPPDEPSMDNAARGIPIGPAERESGAPSSSASPAAAARRGTTNERRILRPLVDTDNCPWSYILDPHRSMSARRDWTRDELDVTRDEWEGPEMPSDTQQFWYTLEQASRSDPRSILHNP